MSDESFSYSEFVSRNSGYVASDVQQKIRNSRLFIAGCGVGSQFALAATRLGVTKFRLIDGDTISQSNLNRQAFEFDQIGQNKAEALRKNILAINPQCDVEAVPKHLDSDNLYLLDGCDFVFDTIDFLDMNAILALHEAAEDKRIPVITGMGVAWGAACMYFPNQGQPLRSFRRIFNISNEESSNPVSYLGKFTELFMAMKQHFDHKVVDVMLETLQKMRDGTPCPAPQVVAGAYSLASLMMTSYVRLLEGKNLPGAPKLILVDIYRMAESSTIHAG
jgi:molybdopterin-synthase adenylyltransferase